MSYNGQQQAPVGAPPQQGTVSGYPPPQQGYRPPGNGQQQQQSSGPSFMDAWYVFHGCMGLPAAAAEQQAPVGAPPQQGYPPPPQQGYPPPGYGQQQQSSGRPAYIRSFMDGCLLALCCCCFWDACF